jgi:hypothetical protein
MYYTSSTLHYTIIELHFSAGAKKMPFYDLWTGHLNNYKGNGVFALVVVQYSLVITTNLVIGASPRLLPKASGPSAGTEAADAIRKLLLCCTKQIGALSWAQITLDSSLQITEKFPSLLLAPAKG